MAAHANRPRPPLSSRPINPNPRNPDANSTISRSFTATKKPSPLTNQRRLDPFTPANSPSDFGVRRSVGRDCEEKEIEGEDCILKGSKLQSLAKGCKNFMLPTISAASEFSHSLRKALVDRNEPVQTSYKKGSVIETRPVSKPCKNFMAPTISAASKFTPSLRKVLVDRNEPVPTSYKKGSVIETRPVSKPCKNFMAPTISAASKFTPSLRKVLVDRNEPVPASYKKGSVIETRPISKPCKNFMVPTISAASKFTPSLRKVLVDRNELVQTSYKRGFVVETRSVSKVTFSAVITDSDALGVQSKVVQSPIDADPCLPPYDPKTNYLSPRPHFIRYKPNPRVKMLLNKERGMDSDEYENSLMAEMLSEGFSDSDEASADMAIGLDEEIEATDHVSELPLAFPVSSTPVDEILLKELVGSDGKKPRKVARLMNFFCMMIVLLVAVCLSVSVTRAPSFDESLFMDLSLSDLSSSSFYEQPRDVVASARSSVGRIAASFAALVFKLANELVEGEKQAPLQFMSLSDLLQEDTRKEAYFLKRVKSIEEDEFEEELDSRMEDEAYADEELDLEAEIDAFEEMDQSANLDDYIEKETDETTAETASDTVILTEMDQSSADPHDQETEVEAATEMEKSQVDINGASDNAETESSVIALAITCLFAAVVGVAALVYKRFPGSSSNVVQVEPVVPVESEQRDDGVTRSSSSTKAMEQEEYYSESWQKEMSSSYHERSGGGGEVKSSERKARRYSKRESLASSSGSPPFFGSFTTYERIPIKTGCGVEEITTLVRRSSRFRKR